MSNAQASGGKKSVRHICIGFRLRSAYHVVGFAENGSNVFGGHHYRRLHWAERRETANLWSRQRCTIAILFLLDAFILTKQLETSPG